MTANLCCIKMKLSVNDFTDRELAMQSQEVLESAGKECGVASVCVYGGVSL